MFEPAVQGFGGSVGGAGSVDVGRHIGCPLVQGPPERAEFDEGSRDAFTDSGNDGGHCCPPACPVRVAVRGDHPLQDAPGGLDLDVVGVGEQDDDAFELPVGEHVRTGVQGPPSPVQRVVLEAAVAVQVLVDTAPAPVQSIPSERVKLSV